MKFEKLNDKQIAALELLLLNKYREILFDGGSRAGKTFLILKFFIICCLKYPEIRFLAGRLIFAHAKASLWKQTLVPMLKNLFSDSGCKINESDFIVTFPNGSEIWLGGLDDKERTDKILGQEYAAIFLNEAVRIPETTAEKVRSRLAQKIDGFKNFIIYDCNPGNPLHWIYKKFIRDKEEGTGRLHWMPEDNRENLADGYIEEILDKFKGNEYKRFRKGLWVAVEGAVYQNIKEDHIIDVSKDWARYDEVVGGIDFGLHSGIVIWGMKENKASQLYEWSKFGAKETTTKSLIKCLDEVDWIKENDIVLYCDHEPDRIEEICEAGYNAVKAYKDVSAGDGTVNELELYFDIKCKNTFQSMLNLANQKDNFGNY
jgi:PBSX family phage terminase large subunit